MLIIRKLNAVLNISIHTSCSLKKKMKKLEEVQKVDRVKERDFFLKNYDV